MRHEKRLLTPLFTRLHVAGLLCSVFVCGSTTGCTPTFKEPEELAQHFVTSLQEWRVQEILRCVHPNVRGRVRRTLDVYMENLEQRDVLYGHLRRRFGDSIRPGHYPSMQELASSAEYERAVRIPDSVAIKRESPKVAYLSVGRQILVFPRRAEFDMGSWWLKPAPEGTGGALLELTMARVLLQRQTKYFRHLSAGIRDGTINEGNIAEWLAHKWYDGPVIPPMSGANARSDAPDEDAVRTEDHIRDARTRDMRPVFLRYAQHVNWTQGLSGRLWQGRFFSCPLDERHFWEAVWYVERNPVRARLVRKAERYAWSSAAAHCGLREDGLLADAAELAGQVGDWSAWLREGQDDGMVRAIRGGTRTGRPVGGEPFVRRLERMLGRVLRPRKGGRPRKPRKEKKHG